MKLSLVMALTASLATVTTAQTLQTSSPAEFEPGATADDNLPEFFTALQEQLGLKLQPETMVPIFVVDHIERPTEN